MTLHSEEIKPIVLAAIELCLSEGISRSVSQIVSQSVENLMKKFKVDLKTFLGLAMANQWCHAVTK